MRVIISILISLLLCVPSLHAAFSDVPSSSSYAQAINYLEQIKRIQGYSDGTFRPKNSINRAEFVHMIALGVAPTLNADQNCFPDVPKNQWYTGTVCFAKNEGWIQGYKDGTFRPNQTISTAEAVKILLEAENVELLDSTRYSECKDVPKNAWYYPYANTAVGRKIYPNASFPGDTEMTRGLMAEMYFRILALKSRNAPKYHSSQATYLVEGTPDLGGPIIVIPEYSYDSNFVYGTPKPVTTSDTYSEETLLEKKLPYLKMSEQTTYYIGYQETGGSEDPILIRFDNGQRTWIRTDYEHNLTMSRGYGMFRNNNDLYLLFQTGKENGDQRQDYRDHSRNTWMSSYGQGDGENIMVLALVNQDSGQMGAATYLSGIDPYSLETKSLKITRMERDSLGLKITATTTGVPRNPQRNVMQEAVGRYNGESFTMIMSPTLDTMFQVEAADYIRY